MSSKSSQKRNRTRHEFLLTFFGHPDHYEFREVNGFILVKQFDANVQLWEVAIYRPEDYHQKRGYISGIEKPEDEGDLPQERLLV